MTILSPIAGPAATLWNVFTSQTWGPLVSVCRNGTLAQLQGINLGRLVLYENGSSKAPTVFGVQSTGNLEAVLNVHDEVFWVRLALFADMVRPDKNERLALQYSLRVWTKS
jgi:cyclopropane-fatty-acyl-phospholipid synthase